MHVLKDDARRYNGTFNIWRRERARISWSRGLFIFLHNTSKPVSTRAWAKDVYIIITLGLTRPGLDVRNVRSAARRVAISSVRFRFEICRVATRNFTSNDYVYVLMVFYQKIQKHFKRAAARGPNKYWDPLQVFRIIATRRALYSRNFKSCHAAFYLQLISLTL